MEIISTSNLYPHPNNPRLDVGDTSELAESIRAKGILQNLTVVPKDDGGYTVIIGHRRMAAAMEAGLTELPCNVVEMTPAEQMETMLMENIQRSDLTPYEEAQGFQMMLDLGTPKTKIAEKTGFSQTTINHRLNLLKLDQDTLQSTQMSITDLIMLEKIEDQELRNKALKEAEKGTPLETAVGRAVNECEEKKTRERSRAELKELGIEIVENVDFDIYTQARSIFYSDKASVAVKLKELNMPYSDMVCEENDYCMRIYKKREAVPTENGETEEEKSENLKREKCRNACDELRELFGRAAALRIEFIQTVIMKGSTLDTESILKFLVYAMIENYSSLNATDVGKFIIPEYEQFMEDELEYEDLFKKEHGGAGFEEFCERRIKEVDPVQVLFVNNILECEFEDTIKGEYETNFIPCMYSKNEKLEALYKMLEANGYVITDWEKALIDGTHEAYITADDLKEENNEK